ncbi:phage baseplate assembly protein V [Pantanalinema rosaneae CENA516]|uniref:phage baseplate assembly protein V n=1 Tax=Pantanalinema rosaneae TaxID=1620701 RepID=UPI003D6E453F
MNFLDILLSSDERSAIAHRVSGVAIGVVTNNQDPDQLGRVKVKFPWLCDDDESYWARVLVCGTYYLPDVDDEVLVAFNQDDIQFPYVLGTLWNGKKAPPDTNADGKNNLRMMRSRSGHVIQLSDESGKETIKIIDKSGKNSLVIDTAQNTITITSEKDLTLSAPKGTLKLEAQKLEFESSASTQIQAGAGMDLKASANLNVKGSMINLN